MYIEEMVDEINEYCQESLSFIKYSTGWECHSYRQGTLFCIENKERGIVASKGNFARVVRLAYNEMVKDKNKKAGQLELFEEEEGNER